MAATECQSRTLSEVLQLLDGILVFRPDSACRNAPAFDVRVEHVIRANFYLCAEHELLVQAAADQTGWVKSVALPLPGLRPPS